MSRTTILLAVLICLAATQVATAQHSGLGGHKNQWGQPQNGIRVLQGGQMNQGSSVRHNGGNDNQAAAEFWGAIGRMLEKEWRKKHPPGHPPGWPPGPKPSPYPPGPPTWPNPRPSGPTHYDEGTYYVPEPRPRPTPRPTTPVATTPVQTTPVVNVKPPATDPHTNEIKLAGRPLTEAEIKKAKEHFQRRLNELTRTLGCRMPKIDVNMQELMALLVARAIAVEIQIRIWDAVRCGNYETAEELWIVHCPGIKRPFRRSRIWVCFTTFCTRLEAGTCTVREAQDMEQELIACGLADHPCCGAPSLLEEIQECLAISHAVARARPGIQTQTAPVPAGNVDIVYHPGLPDGDTIVLDTETVMLGTGGVGTMHVQHGNVAQQQGYPLATGESLDENNSPLVKSGILIENPTETQVQFVLGNQRFSLEPLGRKAFSASTSQIAFDGGNGGQPLHYTVLSGTSRFFTHDSGWGFHKITSFDAVIDNSANDTPFQYIVQGEHQVVAPHASQSLTSAYPLVIRFDRGNGSATKQVVSSDQRATLTVGLNPHDNLWDLHAAPRKPQTPQPAATSAAAPRVAPAF